MQPKLSAAERGATVEPPASEALQEHAIVTDLAVSALLNPPRSVGRDGAYALTEVCANIIQSGELSDGNRVRLLAPLRAKLAHECPDALTEFEQAFIRALSGHVQHSDITELFADLQRHPMLSLGNVSTVVREAYMDVRPPPQEELLRMLDDPRHNQGLAVRLLCRSEDGRTELVRRLESGTSGVSNWALLAGEFLTPADEDRIHTKLAAQLPLERAAGGRPGASLPMTTVLVHALWRAPGAESQNLLASIAIDDRLPFSTREVAADGLRVVAAQRCLEWGLAHIGGYGTVDGHIAHQILLAASDARAGAALEEHHDRLYEEALPIQPQPAAPIDAQRELQRVDRYAEAIADEPRNGRHYASDTANAIRLLHASDDPAIGARILPLAADAPDASVRAAALSWAWHKCPAPPRN